ncbi:hypothetical protein M9H77_36301 [Catharanthus roseus]|uniref:Uncharacterized protein n=1 Tax=Catharanthus roseus TaxID=4058 RepID=A0ACB9ZSQ6_CATRO|nr:hypothetical protein M9H77_36301 [Catharanthus roseus]
MTPNNMSRGRSLLLVMRWFELVPEGEYLLNLLPWSLNTFHFYRTKTFYVYKLDVDYERWVLVESLGNVALFIGEDESVSFNIAEDGVGEGERLKKNSIYFSDDIWEKWACEYDECYYNGAGHDFGIFHLEDGSIKEIYPFVTSWRSPPSYLPS